MLNIYDLLVFLEAAECENFSETGRNLHLSQPAISQKIDSLQKHFSTKLFVRDGRSMQLTEAGRALIPMAKELVAAARRMDETMISLQGEVFGEMTIGCSTASGKYLLPGLIASFRKQYPLVRINVQVTSRRSVMEKLINGDIALGISSKKIPHRELEYKQFFKDDVILVVSAGHRWQSTAEILPDQLLQEPIILREETAGTRHVFTQSLLEHGISVDMLNVVMELGNAEAIEMAVEQGIGIAFISRLAAERGLELGYIVEVPIRGMKLARDIYLTRCLRTRSSRAVLKFWEYVDKTEFTINKGLPEIAFNA